MKIAITKEHRHFYQEKGWIDFEDLLPLSESIPSPETARDLWRTDPLFKKLVCKKSFASIAVQLSEKNRLQLAFDHYYQDPPPFPLQSASSISELATCLLLSLTSGTGIYIDPSVTPELTLESGPYLLIAYGTEFSCYEKNPEDPDTHFLKHRGHIFGTPLQKTGNPLFYEHSQ